MSTGRLDKAGLAAVEPKIAPFKRWTAGAGENGSWGWADGGFKASNPVGAEGLGGYFNAFAQSPEEAAAKWHVLAERARVKHEAWEQDLDLYGQQARSLAHRATLQHPFGLVSGYGFDRAGSPLHAGMVTVVWGHGRYRFGIITKVSPTGKRVTVLWFSPADLKNGQRFGHRSDFNVGAVEVFS